MKSIGRRFSRGHLTRGGREKGREVVIAVYVRVSSSTQDTKSQELELKRWAAGQGGEVRWYRDKFTGNTLDRPGLDKLLADVRAGKVKKVVVWRLDRLGRTARGLHEFFEELLALKVGFLSLKDSLDLGTPAGRLMAGVLASVAQYETEVRRERQLVGIAKVREQNGGKCPWGGRKKGARSKVTEEKEAVVLGMNKEGHTIARIGRTVGVTRKTIYEVLERNGVLPYRERYAIANAFKRVAELRTRKR
jgi:DNA invertase Pin-like site-specific DNA recombinase